MTRALRFRDVATGQTWSALPSERLRVYQSDADVEFARIYAAGEKALTQSMTAGGLDALLRSDPRVRVFVKAADGYRLTVRAVTPAGLSTGDALATLRALARRAPHGLVFVPDFARAYPGAPPEVIRRVLLVLAHEEAIELRPESGLGTLTPAEAVWCPRGAGGVVLSYTRVLR